jgi:hypothetical protein
MKMIAHSTLLMMLAVTRSVAFDYWPLMAEQPKSPEVISASIASVSSFYIRHLDAPDSLKSVRGFIATYRKGVTEPAGTDGSSMGGSPEWKHKLAISVAVRAQDLPKYLPGKGCPDAIVPGTGSTFIGMSYLSYAAGGGGHSGSGTQTVIKHSEIDMMKMAGPLDPAKLPFTIDTLATREQHAIPVFVWLPTSFDPTKAPKKLMADDLPDGTIIVYAVIN